MSAPRIILDNLPSLCQKCQIWWKFDVVITKIILLVFLRHGVVGNPGCQPGLTTSFQLQFAGCGLK